MQVAQQPHFTTKNRTAEPDPNGSGSAAELWFLTFGHEKTALCNALASGLSAGGKPE